MVKHTRKRKGGFKAKPNRTAEEWYDIIDDYSLIVASFAKQYGIRLLAEPEMTWAEFCMLLEGIMPDTPLGNIVQIRAEKDAQTLKQFTSEQKRIRNEWRRRQAKNNQYDMQDMENLQKTLKSISYIKK